jgi:diguanylate cyclase (GGDEF)-like protein
MIYENSRALAAILDSDGVVREVTKILGNILQYDHFAMVLRDRYGNLFYRSRSINGRNNLHPQAIDADQMGLLRRVCDVGEPIRLKDLNGRDDYGSLGKNSNSLLVVPMKSHGQVQGVLTAESANKDHFQERDLQMLSIVSRSAALALENAELHRRTEELTVIDELTETYNYRYFVQKLQEEKRRALRYNLPLSLIMVDIDWFKKLNDTLGHEAGNRVLKQLSAVIKSCIRDVDIFSRYGGEEFVVILPQTTQQEASTLGERIRARVERTKFETASGQLSTVTVSVGVSSFPENGRSHEDLVSITDQALYRAKGEGRNLVCTI